MNFMGHVIAIDGPRAAVKATIARRLRPTPRLYLHRYRRHVSRHRALGAPRTTSISPIPTAWNNWRWPPRSSSCRSATVLLNGEDVTAAIRTAEVSEAASKVAAHPGPCAAPWWRSSADRGRRQRRDGRPRYRTVVFPNASVKIFLDADPRSASRAARRANSEARRPKLPRRSPNATARPAPRRIALVQAPDAIISIPPASREDRWKRRFSGSSAPASPTERNNS